MKASNVDLFSGIADLYDAHRPKPPAVIADILIQQACVERPALAVDIGSGTGLATIMWAERADKIIGIEPNADMRRQAESRTTSPNVTYRDATSSATGLPDGCADIVTCSQALHWLEPESTLAEVARILRPGGVFAAYDCDFPPLITWEAELLYSQFRQRESDLRKQHHLEDPFQRWDKSEHRDRMRASSHFRYVREAVAHHREMGDAERLVGLALSQAGIAALLKLGLSEAELGVDAFRAEAGRILGKDPVPWHWSYRIRFGVR